MPLRLVRWCANRTRDPNSRNVAIDDLDHADVTGLSHEVPGLSLDASRVDCEPFHVILGQLGIGRGLCLLADGLDGRRSVDGLLSAGDVGQPGLRSVAVESACSGAAYCCFAQFIILAVFVGDSTRD